MAAHPEEPRPVRPKRCLGCGYILEGLPGNRCPECGRAFDLSDPTTYRIGTACPRWWLAFRLVRVPPPASIWIAASLVVVVLSMLVAYLYLLW